MATVIRENIAQLTDRIDVTVAKEDYLPNFEASLKQYARKANIPGFRKGMVPVGMIRKMYGPSVFTEEVLKTVERELTEYIRKESIEIFAQPLPSEENDIRNLDCNAPGDYRFSFEIGLKPEVKVADLSAEKMVRFRVDVTDAMVEEEVERMQRKAGQMTEPETVSSEDNVLNVRFEACDESGQVAEGTEGVDNSLLVKYFREDFRNKLMGLAKDAHVVLRLGEAFDEKEREWLMSDLKLDKEDPASLDKPYRMSITKLGMVIKAEMGEPFFKEIYPSKELKTEQEFRDQVRADIQQYFDKQADQHMHHELYHVLKDKTQMSFPEGFLRRWLKEGQENPKTDEEVEAEFPKFLGQLRWTLVSDKIVRDHDIQVTREEVVDNLRQQVLGYFGGMSLDGNLDWLDGYVERMMKDRDQVDGAYRKVLTEKVFDWAATQVTPTDKIMSVDAFRKELEAHQHEH